MSKDITRHQIISIVGPTASGKTARALEIAAADIAAGHYRRVHLLSADSRQVYQDLETLTGADIPSAWRRTRSELFRLDFFESPDSTVTLHGVSVIAADQDWSVAHFHNLYLTLVDQLDKDEQLIVVGGTGLYQAQLQSKMETISVPPNQVLRQQLDKMELGQLQEQLQKIDPEHLQKMNNSDRHNPRRLVRAIEVAKSKKEQLPKLTQNQKNEQTQIPVIYLQGDPNLRSAAITKRVEERFQAALTEVEQLIARYQINLEQLPD